MGLLVSVTSVARLLRCGVWLVITFESCFLSLLVVLAPWSVILLVALCLGELVLFSLLFVSCAGGVIAWSDSRCFAVCFLCGSSSCSVCVNSS